MNRQVASWVGMKRRLSSIFNVSRSGMKTVEMVYLTMNRYLSLILFTFLTVILLGLTFDTALAKDELCYFSSKEIGGGLGGCAKNMDAEIKEIKRESQISIVHVKVKKRGTYAGSIMFETCCFCRIAKSRGYRYFVTLEERDLEGCQECEWNREYVLGFLTSKDDSFHQIFSGRTMREKEYKIEDINSFSMVCGYLPIPSLELHRAVYFGDLETIKEITERKKDLLNTKDDQDFQPLHIAVVEGYPEIVRFLVKSGADINGKGQDGWAPLHMAVKFNQRDIVQLLLGLNADPSVRMNWGNTPLHNAAYEGNLEIADIFIKSGVDVDVVDDQGNTPLHGAASRGHVAMVKYLVEKGAEPKKKNKAEQTPLFFAEAQKHKEVIVFLKGLE